MLERIISIIIAAILSIAMGACNGASETQMKPTVPSSDVVTEVVTPQTETPAEKDDVKVPPSSEETGAANGTEPTEEAPVIETPDNSTNPSDPSDPIDLSNPTDPSDPPAPTVPTKEIDNEQSLTPTEPDLKPIISDPEDSVDGDTTVPPTEDTHVHSYTSKTTPVTCTQSGKIEYTCACGSSYNEVISALGHNYGRWYLAKEPTYEEDGVEKMICERCGHEVSNILEKLPIPLTNDNADEIAELVIKYINEIRAEQGACTMTTLSDGMEYAKYRSEQMAERKVASHNSEDILAAANALQYGKYFDPSEYGMEGEPYYKMMGREAVAKNWGNTPEEVARNIAEAFAESNSHWSYVGGKEYKYIAAGVTMNGSYWYCCVIVDEINIDENPMGY